MSKPSAAQGRNVGADAATPSGTSALERVDYVDRELYDALKAAAARSRARSGPGALAGPALEAVQRFLFLEARLLDLGRYRDWAELLTGDCVYWVPADTRRPDPLAEAGINFDDRRRLLDRIALIETGELVAQMPPSRTCRTLSNIEAWRDGAALEVRSNLVIWEYRRGATSCFAGSQTHHLIAAGEGFRIRWKIVNLIDCDRPQGNITFIL